MQSEQKNFAPKFFTSVCDGYEPFVIEKIAEDGQGVIYVADNGINMTQTAAMLRLMHPEYRVFEFPAWDTVPYDRVSPNGTIMAKRIETLSSLLFDSDKTTPIIVITSVGAVLQKLPPARIFHNAQKMVQVGSKLNFDEIIHYVSLNGYLRVEQVMEAGEYAVRGDIIDIFPSGSEQPLRIDLFDDEVERLRIFDAVTQRTIGELNAYVFQAANEVVLDPRSIKCFREKYRELFGAEAMHDELYESISKGIKVLGMEQWLPLFYEDSLPSLFDYFPQASVLLGFHTDDAVRAKTESIHDYYAARTENMEYNQRNAEDVYRPIKPELLYLSEAELHKILQKRNCYAVTSMSQVPTQNAQDLHTIPGRNFTHAKHVSLAAVYEDLKQYFSENARLKRIVCCYTQGSRDRLAKLMAEHQINDLVLCDSWFDAHRYTQQKKIALIIAELPHGFRDNAYCIVSEQDILGERQHRKVRKINAKNFIEDISVLNIGELVVHAEHGICRFLGLENIMAGGAPHDCLKLLFAHDDKLFVPVENIDVISHYGSEDENVALDVLGGAAWQAKKAKVKEKIKDIAEKLIKVAAERHLKTAESFVVPEGAYDEFCARFPYSETDDQLHAIHDVLSDLAAGEPMDRLVCGDVGFGKTEVALRAAFTVAMSGAQVAIIVPTTLLARQHYLNFVDRMQGFPINVRMLSRLTSAKNSKETKQGLADGHVDIVIGTHALLAKDIQFNNLGLLIIDEEQHFGVAHKEKLKALKADVHVLTLSATPIPRTLELSLTGVKQLSIIATPPVDRLAARTFVMPFDRVMIKEAMYREKFRGGQSFFVCPRVSDIREVQQVLSNLLPNFKIAVAHGQMSAAQLEEIVGDFADGQYDILLSTTIIESGIDMPKVNTMIIHRADMFGLAQLYQLRGRIGRSKVRGYCYFTIPQRKKITPVAEKRLAILKALDTLGAGFSLASHDMDIRGAGNVLGTEQSGHIKDVGIALYQHMLEEEIMRQKAEQSREHQFMENDWMPQITTGIPLMIPESYVKDLGVRMGLYKRIGAMKTSDEIKDMREEMIDRFGDIPQEVENLLQTIEIKYLCYQANVAKIDAGMKGILLSFHNNRFDAVDKLMDWVARSFGMVKIRPDQKLFIEKDLSAYKDRIDTIKTTLQKLIDLRLVSHH